MGDWMGTNMQQSFYKGMNRFSERIKLTTVIKTYIQVLEGYGRWSVVAFAAELIAHKEELFVDRTEVYSAITWVGGFSGGC